MKKPKTNWQFQGYISTSPSNGSTRQVVITTSPEVARELDAMLLSKGIIALKEGFAGEPVTLRIDISRNEENK